MGNRIFIALLIAHWLGDYTHLATPWMLKAKRIGSPIEPIAIHGGIHTALVFLVLAIYSVPAVVLIILISVMFITHTAIDILKGKMNVWFPALQSPANPFHWYVFGLDQTLHILVILIIANVAS